MPGTTAITFAGLSSTREWSFQVGGATERFPVRSRLTVTTAEAALDAAIAGAGLTRVLSYQAAAAVRDGRLVLVLRDFEPAPDPVSLVYPSGRLVPLKLRAFLDFAVPRLKARLLEIARSIRVRRSRSDCTVTAKRVGTLRFAHLRFHRFPPIPLSSPGLTGRSSNHRTPDAAKSQKHRQRRGYWIARSSGQ